MFHPKVSIIIPVYNGENYVKEAIDSALAQTYDNIEIIVVNDGSKDNTEKICKCYKDKINYYKKENGGTSTALNLGIKHMTGEYFSWLSHDDMYYPKKIERQIEELSKLEDKNTIMMTDLDGIDENYKKIYKTKYINHINEYKPREKSYLHPIIYNQTHGCTLLIPKKCFDVVGLFDETQLVAQDFEFFYRAFSKFPHKLIPEILVTARDSSNRQGRRSHAKGDKEYSALYIKMIENLSEKDIKQLAKTPSDFYNDMQLFFKEAGYTIAEDYIKKIHYSILEVSSYDLIGNKFNGYDLHLYLRDKGIDASQLVLYKESKDKNTYKYNFLQPEATKTFLTNKYFLNSSLIHFHLIHNILDLNYLPLITKLKPTVITLHDPFFLGGHCVHHFDCDKWKNICYDCPYLNSEFAIPYDISTLNFLQKKDVIQRSNISAIVTSKWMLEKVKKSPIWKDKKLYYLPFGINQNIFKPITEELKKSIKKELLINSDNTVLMLRADNGQFKGLDVIKSALKNMQNIKNITIITVGEKKLLDDYKSQFDIKDYGWIKNDEDLAKLYQISDLFLMPSKQETFGMMAIEAMSCATPVLALDCLGSALPEIINSPESGIAVNEKDYTKTLLELITNKNKIEELSVEALKYAENNYNLEKYLKKTIEVYNDVVKNHTIQPDEEFLLQQLKKVENVESKEQLMPSGNWFISTYRKLPISFRKKVKKIIMKEKEQ